MTIQFHLGQLPKIRRPALLAWGMDRAIVFATNQSQPEVANFLGELAEAVALQAIQTHTTANDGGGAINAQLHFYESAPSPQYPQLKRLLAHASTADSAHSYGTHLTHHKQAAQSLHDLTQLAHQRFARMATAQVNDWLAYNQRGNDGQQSKRQEPWHFVFLTDLHDLAIDQPAALQTLKTLCEQGPRAGIVPILLSTPTQSLHHAASNDHTPLHFKYLNAFWDDVVPKAWGLSFPSGRTTQPINQHAELWRLLNKFGMILGLEASMGHALAQTLMDVAQVGAEQASGLDFLNVRLGLSTASSKPLAFRLGEASDCYHAFIGGANRSGKTTLINNLILGACEAHTPQQLQLSLLDFKNNVGFGAYKGLAHIATLIESQDPSTVERALSTFANAIDERSQLFAAQPQLVNGTLNKYNALAVKHNLPTLPRWVMIVDEAQVLFENRALKPLAKHMLTRISRMGAGLGLHLIICTQSFQNVEFEGDVKGQFRLRVGLKLANSAECRTLMGHDNDAPLHLNPTRGSYQAVVNNEYGLPRGNQVVDLDALPDDLFLQRLAALKAKFPAATGSSAERTSVSTDSQSVASVQSAFENKPYIYQPPSQLTPNVELGDWAVSEQGGTSSTKQLSVTS
jgi:FtsK/SpoIIIE family